MNKGRFIVFEGIDGSGKTTQARLLAEHLEKNGRKTFLTAEPTTLPTGRALREALSGKINRTECQMAVMFVDDRIAHNVHPTEGIAALLDAGIDVICDRYYYSTLAYQGQSTDYAWVKSMNLDCPEIRKPDLCIYIDLLPNQSLERISRGRDSVEIYENLDTLTKVREQFLSVISDLTPMDNIRIIDGYRTVEAVFADILNEIDCIG
ncbi:MAG: dTMP kinase [Ruminococcaceae bacterium]|nr:dTMP kinase [Oscillospiraceae bacterium]